MLAGKLGNPITENAMRSIVVGLALATVMCATAEAQVASQQAAEARRPEVSASGSGEVMTPPDLVHVSFTVVTRGASAAEAGKRNVAQMTPLLAAIKRQGIADSAIKTVGYSVSRDADQDWTPGGVRPRAENEVRYTARNAVSVTLRDLNRLGAIIDTALATGASEVENINWASSAERTHRLSALGLAVQSARAEAEAMAKAAGGSLGDLIELSEGEQYQVRFAGAAMMRLSQVVVTGTSMSPRDITIAANVRIRWAFVPAPR